jgi:hypothetical protein
VSSELAENLSKEFDEGANKAAVMDERALYDSVWDAHKKQQIGHEPNIVQQIQQDLRKNAEDLDL